MAGVGHRKNITAMSATTVTALTTLTGHIPAEADPITETTIIPVTTITLSMTTTRKVVTPNIKRIRRTKHIRSIMMMIRSSAEKLPEEKNLDIQISSGWPQVLVHKLTTAAANRAGLDVNMLDVRVLGANAFI
jgi:predicted regulator of amino acid metabolism with ACT domain